MMNSAPTRSPTAAPAPRPRRGFSLVEVLIAVFVFSLGMLGLASIFPVVLRQQRTAGEVTEGTIALGSIESALRSNVELNRTGTDKGWGIFQDDDDQQTGWSNLGQWMLPALVGTGEPNFNSRLSVDATTGLMRIHSENPTGPAATDPFGDDVLIPLSSRLGPAPFVRGATPRVEWIMAARRLITERDNNSRPLPTPTDELEIAVFVRPIDRGIQVPRRDRADTADWARLGRAINLSDVILANEIAANGLRPAVRASEARVAVAVRGTTGVPTGNGQGLYATLFGVPLKDYVFDDTNPSQDDDRSRLQLGFSGSSPLIDVVAQFGQRLVDARGNVYTVRGSTGTGASTVLLIDPPVPTSISQSKDVGPLVASPVIPTAVEIFRVRP